MLKKLSGILKKKKEGYLTIELTMVFSIVFFSLLLILFIGMVLYQEVRQQSVAIQASEQGAMYYEVNAKDKGNYKSKINSFVEENINANRVLSGNVQNAGNYASVENYIFAKRIKVQIKSGYKTPAASIGETFGRSGPFQVSTTAVSAVADSAEFVRNVDLVMDLAKQTKVFETVEKGFDKIMDAVDKLDSTLQ